MRHHLFDKFGVDLTAVEGVSIQAVLAFLGEVGTDVSKFATAEHFVSWLGRCPDNRSPLFPFPPLFSLSDLRSPQQRPPKSKFLAESYFSCLLTASSTSYNHAFCGPFSNLKDNFKGPTPNSEFLRVKPITITK